MRSRRPDPLDRERRVVVEDFALGHACCETVEHDADHDPRAPDDGLAVADQRVSRDQISLFPGHPRHSRGDALVLIERPLMLAPGLWRVARRVSLGVVVRDFRFGLAISNGFGDDPVAAAVRAEAAGFDVVVIGDHIGPELSPIPTLAAIAAATTSVRLGIMVVNADIRNPVQLAWDAATLDRLSGGRFELGLGAGHTPQEYSALGLVQDPPTVRKCRLMEAVEIISELLAGRTVTRSDEFFDITDACVAEPGRRIRLLVGGNGSALLEHAGRHADIVGLQGLGRTLPDGHRHTVRWTTDHLERQLDQLRAGAGDRFDQIELSALVQIVTVTDDADAVATKLCERVGGLSVEDVAEIPYALIGTVDEIADKAQRCRQRWGISYFVVRDHDQFAPVIAKLR